MIHLFSFYILFIEQAFEEIGALDYLDKLQSHENEEVYNYASELIEAYFNEVQIIDNFDIRQKYSTQ